MRRVGLSFKAPSTIIFPEMPGQPHEQGHEHDLSEYRSKVVKAEHDPDHPYCWIEVIKFIWRCLQQQQ